MSSFEQPPELDFDKVAAGVMKDGFAPTGDGLAVVDLTYNPAAPAAVEAVKAGYGQVLGVVPEKELSSEHGIDGTSTRVLAIALGRGSVAEAAFFGERPEAKAAEKDPTIINPDKAERYLHRVARRTVQAIGKTGLSIAPIALKY